MLCLTVAFYFLLRKFSLRFCIAEAMCSSIHHYLYPLAILLLSALNEKALQETFLYNLGCTEPIFIKSPHAPSFSDGNFFYYLHQYWRQFCKYKMWQLVIKIIISFVWNPTPTWLKTLKEVKITTSLADAHMQEVVASQFCEQACGAGSTWVRSQVFYSSSFMPNCKMIFYSDTHHMAQCKQGHSTASVCCVHKYLSNVNTVFG